MRTPFNYNDHTGLWVNELKDWVPDTIFDAHIHLGQPDAVGKVADERYKEPLLTFTNWTLEDARDVYASVYSGKNISGAIAFGFPLREVRLEQANAYICNLMRDNPDIRGFIISSPQNTERTIRQFYNALKEGVRFYGVKPYYDLLGKGNYQTSMHEIIQPDLLEFMNHEKLILMLHTTGIGVGDSENQNFIRLMITKYPGIKIILAHMGRYLKIQQFLDFMDTDILDCPWVYLEMSSASRAEVYQSVISRRELWSRLLFGSDMPYGLITGEEFWSEETGPIFLTRDLYAWSNPEWNARFALECTQKTYNTYHTIKAFKDAIGLLQLPASDVEKLKQQVFMENAQNLFDKDNKEGIKK